MQDLRLCGRRYAARAAHEKWLAEIFLQSFDVLAHRAVGDVQFLRRKRQAAGSSGGLEHPKGFERRDADISCHQFLLHKYKKFEL